MDPWTLYLAVQAAFANAWAMARRDATEPENLALHPLRLQIIEWVERHPGITLAGICDALGFNRGTATHHLHLLERAGILDGLQHGRGHHVFPGGTPPALKRRIAVLRSERTFGIVMEVLMRPGLLQKDLTEQVGLSRRVVRQYLDVLLAHGLLEERRVSRTKRYFPTELLSATLSTLGASQPDS